MMNAEGIPSARGGTWALSALDGSGAKGLGMLRNEIYIGRVAWNRRQWLKDPDTGKRRYVERPREEWQEREQPELRIVSDDLWWSARGRERSAPLGTRSGKGAVPRTLFGGLLQCPACGGPMVAVDARRYGCNLFKDRGPAACGNRDGFPRLAVDQHLVAVLRDELLSPAALANLRKVVRSLLEGDAEAGRASSSDAPVRLRTLDGEIARLVDAVAAVGLNEALQGRLVAAEAERRALLAQAGEANTSAGRDGRPYHGCLPAPDTAA